MTVEEGDLRPLEADPRLTLLDEPPWDELERDLTLLLVRPPLADWVDTSTAAELDPAFWLILDAADARTLLEPWLSPLMRDGLRRVRDDGGELTVLTVEACAALLEASTRRAFETRWTLRHAEVLHDPRGRHEGLATAAARLEVDALERSARALYLQAFAGLDALQHAGGDPLIAAGEAAGAVTRLACLLDEGCYPPTEWLYPAARATQRSRWLRPWLDSLTGDEDARGRAAQAAPDVLRELASGLRAQFSNRPWLQDPERFALRAPRGRSGG
ncbi:MAG: hypothetical protein F4X80_10710 [Chloroflexi bacterium]|nr:hypothetical protein [Chloroflexota bacterium]